MSDGVYITITYVTIMSLLVLIGIGEVIYRRRGAIRRRNQLTLSGIEGVRLVSTARCSFCGRGLPLFAISYDKDWRAYCNDPEMGHDCHLKARL